MAKATGIGGIFFRSRDTAALAAWYQSHLGVTDSWEQATGMTVFAPFKETTTYFPPEKQWMINFRVDDLDELMAQLQAAGIATETRPGEWERRRPVASAGSPIPKATRLNSGSRRRPERPA